MDTAFERSLRQWAKTDPDASVEPFASFEAALTWVGADHHGDDRAPVYPGHRFLATVAIKEFMRRLEDAFGACGSPVERLLLSAFLIVGYERDYALRLKDRHSTHDLTGSSLDTLILQPQAQIGLHRVDFLLVQESIVPDFEHQRTLPDGMTIPGSRTETAQMIVECDGHDFHDRTKEQASRDRSRDRALQALGFRVYRYTGSDLWRDVFKCADEAVTHITKMVYGHDDPLEEWQEDDQD